MDKNNDPIIWFNDLGIEDVPIAGGKNTALGEMYRNLTPRGIKVPNGFAITASAYRLFLKESGIEEKLEKILSDFDVGNIKQLQKRGGRPEKL